MTMRHSLLSLRAACILLFTCLLVLVQSTSQASTRYPVVLVPGIFAFDSVGPFDYWYQIPRALERQGVEVYVAPINAFASSAERGAQLLDFLEAVQASALAKRGVEIQRFNLIGHSQGGVTARFVMYAAPELVASITTIGTPHTGSPVADVITGAAPQGSLAGRGFETLANAVGNLVNLLASGNPRDPSDIYGMLHEFNQEGAARFNAAFPAGLPDRPCGQGPEQVVIDGHPVRFYSWAGNRQVTHLLDPSDYLFAITGLTFKGEPNDGITGACASRFGRVISDRYRMNHIDLNNQLLGLVSWFETNPKTLFVNHAKRLRQAGL
ncbi:MAG: triacylglycerol lipase [Marinobacter sp.]|nr:triacylglycerol lipase [Marinobacter sp.]